MSTGRVTPPTGMRAHHWWMPIVFVTALVVAFFAFAPAALACDHSVVIHKVETGALAPGGTYTILMTGPDFSRQVTVDAGGTATIAGVPPGLYEFDEVDAPEGATIEPNPLLLTAESSTGTTVDVYVTNPYRDLHGKLAIHKIETGTAAPGGTYTFDITGPVTLTATVTAATTWTSDWLPLGTYTITERDAPAGATISPATATIDDDGETITITATNPYRDLHGKLAIHKIETGTAAPGGTYTFDITGPVTLTATVTAATTWTSDWLPLGTYTITERDAPAGATISPATATIDDDGETITITATNPYRDLHGKLAIHKIETGTAAPGGTYTFDITGPVTLTATVTAATTWTSDWLPLGTYTITERDAPAGATISPATATIDDDGETITITATNPYRDLHGKLAIHKVQAGATTSGTAYTMRVAGPVSFTVAAAPGTTWTSDWLPLGTYTVTEVDAPAGATIVPATAVIDDDGETVTVVVTNPTLASSGGTVPRTLPATGGIAGTTTRLAAVMVVAGMLLMTVRRSHRDREVESA